MDYKTVAEAKTMRGLRLVSSAPAPVVKNALDPILFARRDYIFKRYLRLPMDF